MAKTPDRTNLAAARRTYELGRLRWALRAAPAAIAMAAAGAWLTAADAPTVGAAGGMLVLLVVAFRFHGGAFAASVAPGVAAGMALLLFPVLMHPGDACCAGGACASAACVAACVGGGIAAGLGLGWFAAGRSPVVAPDGTRAALLRYRSLLLVGAGILAFLVGAPASLHAGVGGAVGAALSMIVASIPVMALTPQRP